LTKTLEIFMMAYKEGRKFLLETEAKTVCMEYGIPVYLKTSFMNLSYLPKLYFDVISKIPWTAKIEKVTVSRNV